MAKDPSLDEMRDEAYRRQDNLAADIDELIDRVNPKNAAMRWKNEVVGSVKSFSEAGDGKSPSNGVLAVAGGVIGLVVLTSGIILAVALSGDDEQKALQQAAKESEKAQKQAGKNAKKAAKRSSADIEKALKRARKAVAKATK